MSVLGVEQYAGPAVHRQVVDGLVVLTIEDHTLPVVNYGIALRRGAGWDPSGKSGLMFATLEMALRGTHRRDRRAFSDTLEGLGSSIEPSVASQVAVIGGSCLRRHLDETWSLACEALTEPSYDEGELSRYVDETVQELHAERDDDRAVLSIFVRRALFEGHPFAYAPAGEISNLESLTRQDLIGHHRAMLTPESLVLVLGGDITPEQGCRLAETLCAHLPQEAGQKTALPPLPKGGGAKIVLVDKPDRQQVQMQLARMCCDGHSEQALPLWLGVLAFGGTFTSPFTQAVRDERGWSYTAQASFDRRSLLGSPMVFDTAPSSDDAIECLALQVEMYDTLAKGSLDSDAIALARSYALNHQPLSVATVADVSQAVLTCELLGRGPLAFRDLPAQLEAVTDEAVLQALRDNLHPGEFVITMVASAAKIQEPLAKRFPDARICIMDFRDGVE